VLHIAKHARGFLRCAPSVKAHDLVSTPEAPMVHGTDRRSMNQVIAVAADATLHTPQHEY
jgi:hypothetical protein